MRVRLVGSKVDIPNSLFKATPGELAIQVTEEVMALINLGTSALRNRFLNRQYAKISPNPPTGSHNPGAVGYT
jgi:hypothetical protein